MRSSCGTASGSGSGGITLSISGTEKELVSVDFLVDLRSDLQGAVKHIERKQGGCTSPNSFFLLVFHSNTTLVL